MQIITNGDFIFPTRAAEYVRNQLYIWSPVKGTPNLDEVIRFLTHLPMMIIFILFGNPQNNMVVSYFYLTMVTVVSLAAGYYFLHRFLDINQRWTCVVLALFYAFNPVFLGNYSKVGLVLAANMLPLLLTLTKRYYQTRRFSFVLAVILALNVSFIHPFTLVFNAACTVSYLIFLVLKDRSFWRQSYKAVLAGGVCCVAINAFMILPIMSIGTVSKSALSQNISDPTLMSANLVDIANTGNIFTAFSLSKNIFLDYNFYDKTYQVLYYLGALLMYILLLGLLVYVHQRLRRSEKKQIVLCMLGLLGLLLLSTGTFLGIDKLLTFAIGLPGGWAFRSPLKWQFYMPLLIVAMFAIVLARVPRAGWRRLSLAGLLTLLVMLSGYITHDIFVRLLRPKNIDPVYVLSQKTPTGGRVLLVRDDACISYFNQNGSLVNELNAVYAEKSIQVKEVSPEYLPTINATTYNQILACKPQPELNKYTVFRPPDRLVVGGALFYSYHNKQPRGLAYASLPVLAPQAKLTNLPGKYQFLHDKLPAAFDFIDNQQPFKPDWSVHDAFEDMTTADIDHGAIRRSLQIDGQNRQKTSFYNQSGKPVYYQFDAKQRFIKISAQAKPGYDWLDTAPLDLGTYSGQLTVWYEDTNYDFANLVDNPSFEKGPWKSKVDDCFNYDSTPVLGMRINGHQKTAGQQSLQLEATRHLACTNPPAVAVAEAADYMLGLDYQTSRQAIARYSVTFDDHEHTAQAQRLEPTPPGQWQTFNDIIKPPKTAKHLRLTLFGVPRAGLPSTTLYDNLKLVRVPNIVGQFYVLQEPARPVLTHLPNLTVRRHDPTNIQLTAQNIQQPFYVVLNDSYHHGWRLTAGGQVLPHAVVNGHENMWYVDSQELCGRRQLCGGPAGLALTVQFTPQRWYMAGLIISGLALGMSVSYWLRDQFGRPRRTQRRVAASARSLHNV